MSQEELKPYNGETYDPDQRGSGPLHTNSQARRSIEVFNYSIFTLKVMFRSGETVLIEPMNSCRKNPVVVVRVETTAGRNAKYYRPDYSNEEPNTLDPIARSFFERIPETALPKGYELGEETHHHYVLFKISSFTERKGYIYSDALDIAMCYNDSYNCTHPYSVQGRKQWKILQDERNVDPVLITSGFSLTIFINSPNNEGAYRYVNIGENTYAIRVRSLPEYAVGLHIHHTKEDGTLVKEHFSLKDIDALDNSRIKIFKTREEAENAGYGVKTQIHKRESEQLNHDFKIEEMNRKMLESSQKHGYQTAMIESKKHEEWMKRAMELEQLRQKDYYDDRAYRRKDESEMLKHVPTVLGGIAAFLLIVLKMGQ